MDWLISDIHGCYYTLQTLLKRVRDIDSEARFVFLGDYVDRGPFSKEVLDLLISEDNGKNIFLRGNHDDVVDYLLNDHSLSSPSEWIVKPIRPDKVITWWLEFGLRQTLKNYEVELTDTVTIVKDFRNAVPESHKKFLNNLKMHWESDTHFAFHAYCRPDIELPRKLNFLKINNDESLWGRFTPSETGGVSNSIITKWDRIGVFGHTPVRFYQMIAPVRHSQLRLIDTGASMGDYLCAYCTKTDDWILQATDDKDKVSY